MTDIDPLLTGPEAARSAGIDPATWRGYVKRGLAPAPDAPDSGTVPNRRTPRWLASTVEEFKMSRLGQGARTDFARKPTKTQLSLIRYFAGGPVPDGRVPQSTYDVCRRLGWIEPIDEWPYHRTTPAGLAVLEGTPS